MKVVKNKVAPPFRQAEFDIIYGEGVSSLGELVDLGLEHDIIQNSGSWYSYGEEKIGQGRDSAKQWLRDNEEARAEVTRRVRQTLGMDPADDAPAEAEDTEDEELVEA